MKLTTLLATALAITIVCATASDARAVEANPFTFILERNPFSLRSAGPPAAEPPPPSAPAAPLATVELTGITSILSSQRALLEIVSGPGKPMLRPILAAGERVDTVELVSIDLARGEVTIRNGTITTNLTLKVAKAGPTPQASGTPAERVEKTLGSRADSGVQPPAAGFPASRGVVLGGGAEESVPRRNVRLGTAPAFPPLPGRP